MTAVVQSIIELPTPTATTVRMVGSIVRWGSSLLLVGVFALLTPLHSQRRSVVTWMTAWIAQAMFTMWTALIALYALAWPHTARPALIAALSPLEWSARLVFLTALALGAVAAAGWRISTRTHVGLLALAATAGALIRVAASNVDPLTNGIVLVATVVLIFGSAQVVLFHARGERRRGLIFLGVAMTLFGALSTIYSLANVIGSDQSALARFVRTVDLSSGYGDAAALGILAAAVIVVIVQEAFLDTSRAHEQRVLAIAASETRLNGIIQAAQEAIVTVGHDGRIELVNGAVELMLGLPRGDLLGRSLSEFVLEPAALVSAAAALDTSGSRSGPETHTGRGRRFDGSSFPVEFTAGRLRGEGRSGAVIVLRDLTERNSVQAERERFERRLAESEKMMAIGRVVSGVAHELNNPLAVVLGQSEQLVDAAPDGDVQTGLRLIHEHAHRARHIVKDLLTFVRHREEERELINLSGLAERTLASQRSTAATRGVTLASDLRHDLPAVLIDRTAMEQVLVNLIDNALDAAGTNGKVTVSSRASGSEVELVVEDAGRGVPEGLVSRIFEPFFTTKGPGRGTGLGLSVSLGIAEQHAGTLRLENRPGPGVGARFILSLPASPSAAPTQSEPVATHFPRPPARGDGSVAEVMLIDDEAGVRATLGRMFKRAGWSVREMATGDDGLAWLATVSDPDAPAVILCDLKMPGLSGREVYESILQHRPALATRLIFVTGDVVESVSNGFIATSGREVVEKPFTVAEIARAVERTLSATPS